MGFQKLFPLTEGPFCDSSLSKLAGEGRDFTDTRHEQIDGMSTYFESYGLKSYNSLLDLCE